MKDKYLAAEAPEATSFVSFMKYTTRNPQQTHHILLISHYSSLIIHDPPIPSPHLL